MSNEPSILLVEDDLSLADSLVRFLEDHGYRTHMARTVREGMSKLLELRPRLCLLDLNLPDGSGMDILRQMVQQKLPMRAVVMTAFDLANARPPDANGALAGWLTKPVNPCELIRIVESVLGKGSGC